MPARLAVCLAAFVCLALPATGQTITGLVADPAGQPLAGAAVLRLAPADSSLQEGTLTDEAGRFSLKAGAGGKTLVRVQALGYKTLTWATDKANLGTVTLQAKDAAQLREVEVTAQRPMLEIMADKVVVNVAGSINAQGNTALELLRKSPGVVVDKDDNLLLKGKSGIRVLIDGRPSNLNGQDLAAYLRGLQASDIDRIELISNPSAKYEAAGSAGVINIRLKKDRNYGTNGSVGATYAQGIFGRFSQNGSLNHRTRGVNIFGNGSAYQGRNLGYFFNNRQQSDSLYAQRSESVNAFEGFNYKVGADWFVSKRQTVGVLINGNHNARQDRQLSITRIGQADTMALGTDGYARRLTAYNQSSRLQNNLSTNLNYRFADTNGTELTADLDYSQYHIFGNQFVPNVYTLPGAGGEAERVTTDYRFHNNTPTQINIAAAKADYERKLWGGTLSAGGRVAEVKTRNTFDFYDNGSVPGAALAYNRTRSNTFAYRERIVALYASFSGKLSAKLRYNLGLRWERTALRGDLDYKDERRDTTFSRYYLSPGATFFPTAGFSYDLATHHALSFSYRRSLDRPYYQIMNPFELKLDELTYQRGNPNLQPQFAHTLELSHTYRQMLNTSLNYTHQSQVFGQGLFQADARRTYMQTQNLASTDMLNLTLATPLPLASWWQGYLSLSGQANWYHLNIPGGGLNPGLQATIFNATGNGYMQHTFTLGHGYRAEVSGWGTLPGVWGGTFRSIGMGGIDVGLQKQLWQKKGSIKLVFADVLWSQRWRGTSDYNGIRADVSGYNDSRMVRWVFTYNFGNGQIRQARERKTGLDDMNKRVN